MRHALAAALAVVLMSALLVGAVPRGAALVERVGVESKKPFTLTPDGTGAISYFIADPADRSGYRPGDSELAVWALQEWERNAAGKIRFTRVDTAAAAAVRIQWLPWSEEGALGRMEPMADNGRAIAEISIRPDEQRFRPTVKRRVLADPLMRDVVVYYVCLHEIGHALGLSHSENPRDIMWPGSNGVTLPVYDRYRHRITSRDDIPQMSWLSRDDIGRFGAIWKRR